MAHIATDMMQIQNVPKCPVGVAYYKSKVSNELISPNKLNILIVSNALIMTELPSLIKPWQNTLIKKQNNLLYIFH